MNSCINTKIETALLDTNIVKIMNRASKRFRNQLDKDTIYTCQLNALWKTFLNYDEKKGAKFTTYLYKGVFIECMKEINFINKNQAKSKLHDNLCSNKNPFLMTDILDEFEDECERNLIVDKMSNMTIAEIADKYSKNRESVRKKINKLTDKIKNKFE
jgi:predicted transcriptional regulator